MILHKVQNYFTKLLLLFVLFFLENISNIIRAVINNPSFAASAASKDKITTIP